MIELKVRIKSDDITLVEEYLIYEPILLSQEDDKLQDYVNKTLAKFQGSKEDIDITLKITMVW